MIPELDDSRMPIKLGSPLRVPSYSYTFWGIPKGQYRWESDKAYEIEWKGGSTRQMDYVIEALGAAGFENYSQKLRDKAAEFVRNYVKNTRSWPINIMDVGAGVSTVNIWDSIDDEDKNRVTLTMVEPSEKRVEKAAQELAEKGMERDKNLLVYGGKRDMDIPELFETGTFNIITGVASFHHHAYMDEPISRMAGVLRDGGYWVSSDWHNSMWEHPGKVYEFLESLDQEEYNWPTKNQDLKSFRKTYSLSRNQKIGIINAREEKANEQIRGFWRGWAKARSEAIQKDEFDERDDLLMLEGHRPVTYYLENMIEAGLRTERITSLLPDSDLLMLVAGRKK